MERSAAVWVGCEVSSCLALTQSIRGVTRTAMEEIEVSLSKRDSALSSAGAKAACLGPSSRHLNLLQHSHSHAASCCGPRWAARQTFPRRRHPDASSSMIRPAWIQMSTSPPHRAPRARRRQMTLHPLPPSPLPHPPPTLRTTWHPRNPVPNMPRSTRKAPRLRSPRPSSPMPTELLGLRARTA